MKKIYFLSISPFPQFLPYVYGSLRSYCDQFDEIVSNYQWEDPFFLFQTHEELVDRIIDPTILAVSCFAWNRDFQLKICQSVKLRYPNALVVVGGPHIPKNDVKMLLNNSAIDILVSGEGEIPFSKILIEKLKLNPDWNTIRGISFRSPQFGPISTGEPENLKSELSFPSPFLAGYYDFSVNLLKKKNIPFTWLWETNRGCPFNCIYCNWGNSVGVKIRCISLERLQSEMDYFAEKKVKDIWIMDANFGILKRDLEIVKYLINKKIKTGYPQNIKCGFTCISNETSYQVSQKLHENNMLLWGTTLSIQTTNSTTQHLINRPSKKNLMTIKDHQYKNHQIPTYTDLILALPGETKKTFINGVCQLLEEDVHEDFRLSELAVLPNAKLSGGDFCKQNGIKVVSVPFLYAKWFSESEAEPYKIVVETKDMSFEDWKYCYTFGEILIGIHNGAYTRFISKFMRDIGGISYFDFYSTLIEHFKKQKNSVLGYTIYRVDKLLEDYITTKNVPFMHKIENQKDMMEEMKRYNKGKIFVSSINRYIWLRLNTEIDTLYSELREFLENKFNFIDPEMLSDCLDFQKNIILRPDYNPEIGKRKKYLFNWTDYFFKDQALKRIPIEIIYKDKLMGPDFRYALKCNNMILFAKAAIGGTWPLSKRRHFYHQPDCMDVLS